MKISLKEHKVYMSGDEGPFRCNNCEYYPMAGNCNQKDIIKLAQSGKFGLSLLGNGNAKVDPDGCSDYFEAKK